MAHDILYVDRTDPAEPAPPTPSTTPVTQPRAASTPDVDRDAPKHSGPLSPDFFGTRRGWWRRHRTKASHS
jgi:hypothetical protein